MQKVTFRKAKADEWSPASLDLKMDWKCLCGWQENGDGFALFGSSASIPEVWEREAYSEGGGGGGV